MPSTFYYVLLLATFSTTWQIDTDSSYSDAVFEYLDDCDPNVDPVCKEKLESIRDQIADQLTKDHTKNNGAQQDINRTNRNNIVNSKSKGNKKALAPRKQNGALSKVLQSNNSQPNMVVKKSMVKNDNDSDGKNDIPVVYFLVIIVACTLTGVAGIALSGYCWYKLHRSDDNGNKKDYIPGVKKTNSTKSSSTKNGDSKLDYKAEMYHYVHTKNQIAAMEKAKTDHLGDDDVSNGEDDEGEDYTVYECPGLAPTGDMTVVNPLFSDQEVTGSDEGRMQSNRSSSPPSTPSQSSGSSSH